MELIKKHYKKIISYGLIVFGIIVLAVIFITRPTKVVFENLYNYSASPTLSKIKFPFSQDIHITKNNPSFIELRFEDDSINQYQYTITLTHGSDVIFEHHYADEISNIVRFPVSDADLKIDDTVNLKIQCTNKCENAKIALYDADGEKRPKTLIAFQKQDISFYWYGMFPIVVGLALLPLSKEKK